MSEVATSKVGWTTVAFGDVVRQVKDKVDPEESGLKRYIAGEHMDTDDLRIRRWGEIGDDYLGPAFHMRFKPGHVLYGSRRTYLRKVALADFEGITANTTYVLESKDPNVLLPELLPFVMQVDSFHAHSKRESKGSVNPYVNFSDLAWYEFALPHLDEQRQIVSALTAVRKLSEALYSCRTAGQVLLTSAIEAEIKKHAGQVVRIGNLVERGIIAPPQDGNHGEIHPKAADYVNSGIPFLMASDIRGGKADLNGCKFITHEQASSLRIGFAQKGDVLLTHKGTIGETAVLPQIDQSFVMLTPQVTYYRIEDGSQLLARYLYYIFQSDSFYRQMLSRGRQSTRLFVGITKQLELEIPFPDLAVQTRLVAQWSMIESSTAKLEKRRLATESLGASLRNSGLAAGGDNQ
jgi:type I restriction enzyme, S subunit